VAVSVAIRIGAGLVLSDTVQPVTYWAVFGGALNAVVMVAVAQAVT